MTDATPEYPFRVHVQRAVDCLGTQEALGRAINKSQQYIWNLLNTAKEIKAEVAVAIDRETKGAVSKHDLRPDVFPLEDAASCEGVSV